MAQYLAKGGIDKNSAIYRAATRIQSRYRGYAVRKVLAFLAFQQILAAVLFLFNF